MVDQPELIQGLKEKNEAAFAQLLDSYGDRIYNICLGFMGNSAEAEDLSQETLIEIFRSIGGFKEQASLSTWIHRIAVSKCLERIRYQQRKKRFAWIQSLTGLDAESPALPSHYEHPGISLEQKEDAAALYVAISRLPENQRIAFTMSKIDGLSYQEIAKVMDLSISAIESLLHRAKQNLRKRLTNYYKP